MKKNVRGNRFHAVAADGAVDWDHPLNKGLVSWWLTPSGVPAAGGRMLDLCGKLSASLSGFSAGTNPWTPTARGSSSVSLDGTASYCDLGATAPWSSQASGSVSAWVRLTTTPAVDGPKPIIAYGGTNGGGTLVSFSARRISAVGTSWLFDITTAAPAINAASAIGFPLSAGVWYHVAFVSNGTTWAIYVNGVASSLTAWSGTNNGTWWSLGTGQTAPDYSIGSVLYGSRTYGDLTITDLRISSLVPTAAQVGNLYRQSLVGYCTPDSPLRWFSTRSVGTTGIAFDAASNSGDQAAVSSVSFSVPWVKTNGMLAIDVPFMGAAGTVSSVTYGGATCTLIGAQNVVGGTGRVEQWRIIGSDSGAPATGSNTLVVTYSGVIADTSVSCVSYTGVNQTLPTESWNGNSGINAGSATDATVVVTPIADQDWCHFAVATSQTSGIASSNTSRNVVAGAGGTGADSDTGAAISPASAQTGRWTGNGITSAWAAAGYAIRPVAASSPGTLAGASIRRMPKLGRRGVSCG